MRKISRDQLWFQVIPVPSFSSMLWHRAGHSHKSCTYPCMPHPLLQHAGKGVNEGYLCYYNDANFLWQFWQPKIIAVLNNLYLTLGEMGVCMHAWVYGSMMCAYVWECMLCAMDKVYSRELWKINNLSWLNGWRGCITVNVKAEYQLWIHKSTQFWEGSQWAYKYIKQN